MFLEGVFICLLFWFWVVVFVEMFVVFVLLGELIGNGGCMLLGGEVWNFGYWLLVDYYGNGYVIEFVLVVVECVYVVDFVCLVIVYFVEYNCVLVEWLRRWGLFLCIGLWMWVILICWFSFFFLWIVCLLESSLWLLLGRLLWGLVCCWKRVYSLYGLFEVEDEEGCC